jgi:hypothetical protein
MLGGLSAPAWGLVGVTALGDRVAPVLHDARVADPSRGRCSSASRAPSPWMWESCWKISTPTTRRRRFSTRWKKSVDPRGGTRSLLRTPSATRRAARRTATAARLQGHRWLAATRRLLLLRAGRGARGWARLQGCSGRNARAHAHICNDPLEQALGPQGHSIGSITGRRKPPRINLPTTCGQRLAAARRLRPGDRGDLGAQQFRGS